MKRLNSIHFSAGFWTYALIAVLGLVGMSIVAPPLFQQIVNAVSQLFRAVRGG